jgi:hypothetical protein
MLSICFYSSLWCQPAVPHADSQWAGRMPGVAHLPAVGVGNRRQVCIL